jgi:hypothetical protein
LQLVTDANIFSFRFDATVIVLKTIALSAIGYKPFENRSITVRELLLESQSITVRELPLESR